MHLCIFNATNIHEAKKKYENLHLRYVYPHKMDTHVQVMGGDTTATLLFYVE